jgi:3-oxoacyl-[acyl-carrier-protein] synthase-3
MNDVVVTPPGTSPVPGGALMSGGMRRIRAQFAGIGTYLPANCVTNDDLARTVDTSDEWIRERTGIRQRYLAQPHETCAFMATEAARAALAQSGLAPDDIGATILATATPDQAFPATATRVQAALGLGGFAYDLSAACSGFVYALGTADAMIRAGMVKAALIIGAEVYSRILDWQDRGTCVLFGDGAGAMVLKAAEGEPAAPGVLSVHLHSDGSLGDILYVNGAVGRRHLPGHLVMNGREVFRHAVGRMSHSIDEALAAAGLGHDAVDWLVPHQANKRIIDGVARKLGLDENRVVVTVDRHANTSAASIPLALGEAMADGRIRPGHLVLLCALGGGLTWGAALIRL